MTIKEIFDSMAYGPAPESSSEALAWIAKHGGQFGHYIDGAFTAPGETFTTANPATGKPLAKVTQGTVDDVATAVQAARTTGASTAWAIRAPRSTVNGSAPVFRTMIWISPP